MQELLSFSLARSRNKQHQANGGQNGAAFERQHQPQKFSGQLSRGRWPGALSGDFVIRTGDWRIVRTFLHYSAKSLCEYDGQQAPARSAETGTGEGICGGCAWRSGKGKKPAGGNTKPVECHVGLGWRRL